MQFRKLHSKPSIVNHIKLWVECIVTTLIISVIIIIYESAIRMEVLSTELEVSASLWAFGKWAHIHTLIDLIPIVLNQWAET